MTVSTQTRAFSSGPLLRSVPAACLAAALLIWSAPRAHAETLPQTVVRAEQVLHPEDLLLPDLSGAAPALVLPVPDPGEISWPGLGQVLAHHTLPAPPVALEPAVPLNLLPPSLAFDGLFAAIGEAHLFPDAKSIADLIPRFAPARILQDWKEHHDARDFSLKAFVAANFTVPQTRSVTWKRSPDESVRDYITGMWDVLTRPADNPPEWSSLLPLPQPYVVPGGRFTELYYWDSYFTMIGLYESGRIDLMRSTLTDLASLITRYGHIPNGSRTYYLSRSQPAFFALMVQLLAEHDGSVAWTTFLPQLQKEYEYWTDGAERLPPGQAWRHVVRLKDGTLMFRAWDDLDTPRDESYPQDIATAKSANRPQAVVWRDLRAGAETGWDFSSRWFADRRTTATIHTTDLLPVEYTSLLSNLASALSHAWSLQGDKQKAARYAADAERYADAVRRVLWDEKRGAFYDYDVKKDSFTDVLSAATVVPLFLHIATPEQAHRVARTIEKKLLKPGGLVTTDQNSGQQWDSPNGWAPLQWMAIRGLSAYGEEKLAAEIARRWMDRVIGTYEKSGVLLEKYDVVSENISPHGGAGGGEYPMQVGFGWTNGTLLGLMNRYRAVTDAVMEKNPKTDRLND
ncbi:alpha,alpha-trehalase TreF [Acetobacter sp. AN02]|uniref:alpha,alpha-trehalase TreF n=1 Tax=Acetobacter sp. AN02 TaxID=2894186 RepID=UPI002434205C|nr:alpha,alpha-trehalase TreF [Acetobacter sp. AN02]MDG6094490.1 alpha,alpha-trehalase TreF [Acetobacter sp. AN02]